MTGNRIRLFVFILISAFVMSGLTACSQTQIEDIEDGNTTDHTDPDAPKEIQSKEIVDFHTEFILLTRWTSSDSNSFDFRVKEDENGILTAYEDISGIRCEADAELLNSLQKVIDQYDLVSLNGTYRTNESLSVEYQSCSMAVRYASEEELNFTDLNDPYAQWEEDIYDIFAEWFSQKGDPSLYPQKETSSVIRFDLSIQEDGIFCEYNVVNTSGGTAADGKEQMLVKEVYDEASQENEDEMIPIPEDYYDRITEILLKYDPVTKYQFSEYNHVSGMLDMHDEGYYGWGGSPLDEEEDAEDTSLYMYIEYESSIRLNIDTMKKSEIERMKPMTDELRAYLDSFFITE